jgi:outer membrane protein OmpA-like peptidoglycan-associated protein
MGGTMLALLLGVTALGCGAASTEIRPTVMIEDGQLIIFDELSSDEVPLEILFELDSAVIGEGSHRPLQVLAEFINNHPELSRVEVHGHTDEQGTPAYNMRLSRQRARAVVTFLVDTGVDEARLRDRGFGDTEPIARGTSTEDRAQNRRVEFVIATEE